MPYTGKITTEARILNLEKKYGKKFILQQKNIHIMESGKQHKGLQLQNNQRIKQSSNLLTQIQLFHRRNEKQEKTSRQPINRFITVYS